MRHLVGYARGGVAVYVDLIHSEAAKFISQHPYALGLAEEALRKTKLGRGTGTIECDMGRVIGYDFVVDTTSGGTIFYAQVTHDDVYTRFIKNGKPSPTQYITLLCRKEPNEDYFKLQDIWIGRARPPRPGSESETPESRPYWANHAIVLDKQPLQQRTITKICPY